MAAFTTLQSLIWPDAGICAEQRLYARLEGARQLPAAIAFESDGSADFNTYFNLLNLGKWKHHCGLEALHLALSGWGEFLLEVILSDLHQSGKPVLSCDITLSESSLTRLEIPSIADLPAKGLLSFRLTAWGEASLLRADWQTEQAAKRQPDLALSITTYRREAVVEKTVARFETYINTSPYNGLIRLIVVDNGQSAKLTNSDNTQIIQSKNLGGSGGFARGLIEARSTGASHCLFMDDDATVHMGSIERTYQMLAYAINPATAIAGGLADADDCAKLWENAALFEGTCRGLYRGIDLGDAAQVAEMELSNTLSPFDASPERIYGGWWYFAFALDQIKHMPFPFFVRGDDISFSLAHDFRILTLPGVLSFQDSNFADKESALTLYLDLRNHLAHQLSLPVMDRGRLYLVKTTLWFVARAILRCHYDTAAALNLALADLLCGPDYFADHADMAARRNDIKALTKTENWIPLSELPPPDKIRINPRSPLWRLVMIVTLNGLLLPFFGRYGNRVTLTAGRRKKTSSILGAAQITRLDKKANAAYTVTHSKRRAFHEILKTLRHIVLILWRYPGLKSDWQKGYEKLTKDEGFWRNKLGLPAALNGETPKGHR